MRSSSELHTLSWLKKNEYEYETGTTTDLIKSIIICSLFANLPVGNIVFEDGDKLKVLKGNEELSAILDYLAGKFTIVSNYILEDLLSDKLLNKTYKELSVEDKEEFLEKDICVSTIRSMSDKERKIAIRVYLLADRPNAIVTKPVEAISGTSIHTNNINIANTKVVPLATKEHKYKEEINTGNDEKGECLELEAVDVFLSESLNHPFFKKINPNQLSQELILMISMVSEDGVQRDLSSTNILEFKNSMVNFPKLIPIFDLMDQSFDGKESYLRKTHLPMIALCCRKVIENSMLQPHEFKEVIDSFFASNNQEYKMASNGGTSKKGNVNLRIKLMLDYLNK